MTQWFRFYGDAINDPKILKLPEVTRWRWTALLSAASKNEGVVPAVDDLALMLRLTMQQTLELITTLERAKLIDKTEGGYVPHNWGGRQYVTDVADPTSASRSKRYRKRVRDGSDGTVTPDRDATVTVHRDGRDGAVSAKRPDSETDTDSEADQNRSIAGAIEPHAGALVVVEDGWPSNYREVFWARYPQKTSKKKAMKRLADVRKRGVPWISIMEGLDRYIRDKPIDRQWMGPEVFLLGERWNDQLTKVDGYGKAKTGGSIIDALHKQATFFDEQAVAERAALYDNQAGGDDFRRLPDR
jgi:hypothetical protein